MKINILISLIMLIVIGVLSTLADSARNRFFEKNKRTELRKEFPFFDGMPPGILEDDAMRTDQWEANRYDIIKRNDKGECELLPMEKIVRNRLMARPYMRGGCILNATTIGQLSKQCDGVFIGSITEVSGINEANKSLMKKGLVLPVSIKFQIETNLFGHLSANFVKIPMSWCEGKKQLPEKDIRVLVFYAFGYKINLLDPSLNMLNWQKPEVNSGEAPAMLFKDWSTSLRILKTAEEERRYIEIANGYLQLLRREKRSPEKYYEFLKPLTKSPIWRIRQDAREDMLNLLRYDGSEMFDLKKALDDPELMDFFKDYIQYIVLPARKTRPTTP